MPSQTISFPKKLYRKIDKLAEDRKTTFTEMVRILVREALELRKQN